MQCSNVLCQVLLQSQCRLYTLIESLDSDPKVAEFMNTSLGKYLTAHPFIALSWLVFGSLATVPVGLFLVFAMATFFSAIVAFVIFEMFLITLAGAALLCVLCGIAVVAVIVSFFLGAIYITSSNMLNLYYSLRCEE